MDVWTYWVQRFRAHDQTRPEQVHRYPGTMVGISSTELTMAKYISRSRFYYYSLFMSSINKYPVTYNQHSPTSQDDQPACTRRRAVAAGIFWCGTVVPDAGEGLGLNRDQLITGENERETWSNYFNILKFISRPSRQLSPEGKGRGRWLSVDNYCGDWPW